MNRVDRAIAEADDAVTRVSRTSTFCIHLKPRTECENNVCNPALDRDIAWTHLGWTQYDKARKEIRRQKIETACKYIVLTTLAWLAVVLFVVWLRP